MNEAVTKMCGETCIISFSNCIVISILADYYTHCAYNFHSVLFAQTSVKQYAELKRTDNPRPIPATLWGGGGGGKAISIDGIKAYV